MPRKAKPPVVEIFVDGRAALTVEMAAARYGLAASSMRAALSRLGHAATAVAHLGNKPLYLAAELDLAMAARPRRGAPGVPRPHRPAG